MRNLEKKKSVEDKNLWEKLKRMRYKIDWKEKLWREGDEKRVRKRGIKTDRKC